jgi:alpha-1,2-mannosyltransferase
MQALPAINAPSASGLGLMNPYRMGCLLVLAFGYAQILGFLSLAVQSGGIVSPGLPYGADYTSFYAASKLMLAGTPALVYDNAVHEATQTALFGEDIGYFAYFYPPIYMLYCLPMALVGYMPSLILWLGITFAFFFVTMRIYAQGVVDAVPILSFGGTQFTFLVGQNAFLTTGLMGSGLMLLEKRPYLAGLCFGLLAYKPHLGILIPFFLLAAGQWRAIIAAGITVLALAGLSVALFGIETWQGFLHNAPSAVLALETSKVGDTKMHSLFGALRMLGASLPLAYGAQTLLTISIVGIVMGMAWRMRTRITDMAPLVATGALLITPFVLAYDMTLMALPLLWLLKQGREKPLHWAEKAVMMVAFVTPFAANFVTMDLGLPFGPLVVLTLFGLVLRRVWGCDVIDKNTARPYLYAG